MKYSIKEIEEMLEYQKQHHHAQNLDFPQAVEIISDLLNELNEARNVLGHIAFGIANNLAWSSDASVREPALTFMNEARKALERIK